MPGRLPPFLHVQHGSILHAVVEHLPQIASGTPGGITFSSQSGSGSLSCFPGHWVSPATPIWCTTAQAPCAHRYGCWVEAVQRAPGLHVLGWIPQWACHAPLPSHAPLLSCAAAALQLVRPLSLLLGQSMFISFNITGFLFVKFSWCPFCPTSVLVSLLMINSQKTVAINLH